MPFVWIGLGLLAVLLFGLPTFARMPPARLARMVRGAGGVGLIGLALLLLARGQVHFAILLLGVGVPFLLGRSINPFAGRAKTAGQVSKVQTALLRMQLDHDTGAMEGDVLGGRLAGRALSSLDRGDLLALLVECRASDPQSQALMEAYLDHRHPDWRDVVDGGAGPGAPGRDQAGRAVPSTGAMSAPDAREILGVGADADPDAIRAAWREQMKRNHPDQGGSSYLAAKINEAKDVLLGKTG